MTTAFAREALREVRYPGRNRDIVSLGLLHDVRIRDGRMHVSLVLSEGRTEVREQLRAAVRARLVEVGADGAEVEVRTPAVARGQDPWADRGRLASVERIVAVGSGKGGVGKSTVAVNLAVALHGAGWRVGLLDADIYGPSVPMMLGAEDGARRVRMTDDRKILPLEAQGISLVSFGFFLGAESPAVWRGPMVAKAVRQFSRGVVWPPLDFLIVDLPAGTGDVPLSLAQSLVVDAGVVVTTPQRLAAQEAEKAVRMFGKLEVPVAGMVENMSYTRCACGRRSRPFGWGGGSDFATRIGVPFLGSLPFEAAIPEGGDTGAPVVSAHPESEAAAAFREMATRLAASLPLAPCPADAVRT